MSRRFYCELCRAHIEHEAPHGDVREGITAAIEHFRVTHPDERIERWPDGSPVIVDDTLTPADFKGDD